MKTDCKKTVVITGASGGIGLAAAEEFLRAGCTVFGLSRRGTGADGAENLVCDVTDGESVAGAFAEIGRRTDKIDVLVLNAGFGISGPGETAPVEQAVSQFDVNYFGAVRCINAAGGLLRRARGRIVIVSSMAAVLPIPFQAHYSATKAALNAFSRALNSEMRQHGVRVTAVLPGDIQTGFTDKRVKHGEDELYPQAVRAVAQMERDERKGMSPLVIARLIRRVAAYRNPRPYYTAGFKYKLFLVLARILPPRLVDWIIRKLYAG